MLYLERPETTVYFILTIAKGARIVNIGIDSIVVETLDIGEAQ